MNHRERVIELLHGLPEDTPLEEIAREIRLFAEIETALDRSSPNYLPWRSIDELLLEYSEADLRGMLRALAELNDPRCCKLLREYDLSNDPLSKFNSTPEESGYRLSLRTLDRNLFLVQFRYSFKGGGDGGAFLLKRIETEPSDFQILQQLRGYLH